MEWYITFLLFVVGLLAVLLLGVPLYAGIGFLSFTVLIFVMGFEGATATVATFTYSKLANFLLLTVPLFILMAEIIVFTGIGSDLYEMMYRWLGGLPGGLAIASTASCAVFGAMCGSTSPAVAAIGLIAVPEMMKRGYAPKLATGCVATAGGLATLIPPSIIMIVYAFAAGESVGRLFIAGIVPGIVLASIMMVSIAVRVKLNPSLAPPAPPTSWKDKWIILQKVWPIVLLVFLVLVTIYLGVATPTEAAGVGAFGAFSLSFILKKFSLASMRGALLRSVQVTSFIFMVVLSSLVFGFVMSKMGITASFTKWVLGLEVSPYIILLGLQLMYLLLGTIMEQVSIILVTTPLVLPIISALGLNLVWYGILLVVNMEIAGVTPPVGFNLYVIKSIAGDVKLGDIFRGCIPFIICELIMLGILVVFPQLALWLPSKMIHPRVL